MNERETSFINEKDHLVPVSDTHMSDRYRYAAVGSCPFCGWQGSIFLQEKLVKEGGQEFHIEASAQIRCERCGSSTGVFRKKTSAGYMDHSSLVPYVLSVWNNRRF